MGVHYIRGCRGEGGGGEGQYMGKRVGSTCSRDGSVEPPKVPLEKLSSLWRLEVRGP